MAVGNYFLGPSWAYHEYHGGVEAKGAQLSMAFSMIRGHVDLHVLDYPGGVGAKGAHLTNRWMFLTVPAP